MTKIQFELIKQQTCQINEFDPNLSRPKNIKLGSKFFAISKGSFQSSVAIISYTPNYEGNEYKRGNIMSTFLKSSRPFMSEKLLIAICLKC